MARRRKSGIGGASMDSLLDTMTNVVGILVIMLVVTQLGVQDAVRRITGLVTEEELAAAERDAEELRQLLELEEERKETLENEAPARQLTLEQRRKLIEELKERIAALDAAKLDPDKLKQDLEEQRREEQALVSQIETRMAEIASLKARLAETPAGPDPDAKVVNLPNPRPAPPKAEAVELLVKNDRVYLVEDIEELQSKALNEIERANKKLDLVQDPTNPKQLRIDAEKLQKHFEEKFVGDQTFQVKIAIVNGRPELVLEPREKAGIELRRIESGFGRLIAKYRNQPKFLRFRVFPDSFETYIEARNATDRVGMAAGWIPVAANTQYRIGLGNKIPILVAGYTPPPPRPATPPDPNRPPPPPRTDVD